MARAASSGAAPCDLGEVWATHACRKLTKPEKYVEPVQDISLDDPIDDGALFLPVSKQGTVTAHLEALTGLASPDRSKMPEGWPKKGRGLRACLDRLAGSLVAFGVTMDFGDMSDREGKSKGRTWTFHRTFGRVDTLSDQRCPPTCPPNVSTLCDSDCSGFSQVDTLDTSLPDFLLKGDEKKVSGRPPHPAVADSLFEERQGTDPPNNVSNVSIKRDRAINTVDQVDTLGGHVHGHVPQHNVSTSRPADDDDRADDEQARQDAYRAVFERGMYDDESIN